MFYVEASRLVELEKLEPGFPTGYCHRFPPQVLLDRPDCFPEISRHDFCGEFFPSSLPPEEKPSGEEKDMEFRASSNRTVEGHGTTFFTRSRQIAEQWAQQEAKDGFSSVVYEVKEIEAKRFEPAPPPPAEGQA
jgi:hypothetical protein